MVGDPQRRLGKAFREFNREIRDHDLDAAIDKGLNFLMDDLVTLHFTFQLPMETLKSVPDSSVVLKVVLDVPPDHDTSKNNLQVIVDGEVNRLPIAPDSEMYKKIPFEAPIEGVNGELSEIKMRWEKNKGEVFVLSV